MAEKKISGVTYRYDRLPADQGFKMLLRLLKVLGPAKGLLEAIAEQDEGERDAKALAALGDFVSAMDSDAVFNLVMDMVKNCRADGEPCVIGVKPSDTAELLKVAVFAMQTEFGGFFAEGAGSVLQKIKTA